MNIYKKLNQKYKSKIFQYTVKLGYNELGYNELGYNELGYNELGYNELGYNELGYNKLGYNERIFWFQESIYST